ncbi:hypothetical protein J7I94_01625 [Streptomyces sp. ISL-12]|nr:hypothetical protein [Streptomyces sp. ISL-12]
MFDPDQESFAESAVTGDGGWTVRQSGPVPLWDDIEKALTVWEAAGRPGIDAVQLRLSQASHLYWIEGSSALRWEHRLD